jgi:hypothetical protein
MISIMKSIGRKTVKADRVSAPLSAKAPSGKTQAAKTAALGEPSHEDIARRAYELYLERGSIEGHQEEDWLIAEAELRRPR